MPTLTDLQRRYPQPSSRTARHGEEIIVVDSRAQMTPCNYVEQKFRAVLSTKSAGRRRTPK
jgi:hypothetical protein